MFGMTLETLVNLYRCMVDSAVTGCITVWSGDTNAPERKTCKSCQKDVTQVERVQRRFMRMLLGLEILGYMERLNRVSHGKDALDDGFDGFVASLYAATHKCASVCLRVRAHWCFRARARAGVPVCVTGNITGLAWCRGWLVTLQDEKPDKGRMNPLKNSDLLPEKFPNFVWVVVVRVSGVEVRVSGVEVRVSGVEHRVQVWQGHRGRDPGAAGAGAGAPDLGESGSGVLGLGRVGARGSRDLGVVESGSGISGQGVEKSGPGGVGGGPGRVGARDVGVRGLGPGAGGTRVLGSLDGGGGGGEPGSGVAGRGEPGSGPHGRGAAEPPAPPLPPRHFLTREPWPVLLLPRPRPDPDPLTQRPGAGLETPLCSASVTGRGSVARGKGQILEASGVHSNKEKEEFEDREWKEINHFSITGCVSRGVYSDESPLPNDSPMKDHSPVNHCKVYPITEVIAAQRERGK
ncbi:uncharacterized protein [Narcine bancroftii]|uniref:uncharacterized protein n=1 Tax=Narcine bancroftii TaxID=1343680 RepID=UPI003831A811